MKIVCCYTFTLLSIIFFLSCSSCTNSFTDEMPREMERRHSDRKKHLIVKMSLVDAKTGNGVESIVTVKARKDPIIYDDLKGKFVEFKILSENFYDVTVEANGYEAYSFSISLNNYENNELQFTIKLDKCK